MRRAIAFLFLAAAFAAAPVCAQTTGAITGTVVGLGGGAVANAPVRVTHIATKTLYATTSSETGAYTIAQLPGGDYDLSVEVPGFNAYSQKNVAVVVGQTRRFDVHLAGRWAWARRCFAAMWRPPIATFPTRWSTWAAA